MKRRQFAARLRRSPNARLAIRVAEAERSARFHAMQSEVFSARSANIRAAWDRLCSVLPLDLFGLEPCTRVVGEVPDRYTVEVPDKRMPLYGLDPIDAILETEHLLVMRGGHTVDPIMRSVHLYLRNEKTGELAYAISDSALRGRRPEAVEGELLRHISKMMARELTKALMR